MTAIQKVRQKTPLIHHITNEVVMNFTANGLLAYGGSPIMAKERKEVAEIAAKSDGLLINIGTLTETTLEAMIIAGKSANEAEIPVILDPVGVAATNFRAMAIRNLLRKVHFTAIKGNAGEMAYLANIDWNTRGVESADGNIEQLQTIAKEVAIQYQTIAVITGKTDVLCDGDTTMLNRTGHELLTKVTGAGCLLGSIIAATVAVSENIFQAAYDAVQFYGAAAERSVENNAVTGPGTFATAFIDELQQS